MQCHLLSPRRMQIAFRPRRWCWLPLVISLGACLPDHNHAPPTPASPNSPTFSSSDAGGVTYVKSYNIDGANFFPSEVALADDGTSYQVGVLRQANGNIGEARLVIMRTDPAGDVLWARRYGSQDLGQVVSAVDASEAPDGSFWVAGTSARGALVAHYDEAGDLINTVDYSGADQPVAFNDDSSGAKARIAATRDGGYVVAATQSTPPSRARQPSTLANPQVSPQELWLLRADAAGEQKFLFVDDDLSPPSAESVEGLLIEPGDEITVFGSREQTPTFYDFWVARFRTDGTRLFSDDFDGIGNQGRAYAAMYLPRAGNADLPGILATGDVLSPHGLASRLRDPRVTYLQLPLNTPAAAGRQNEPFEAYQSHSEDAARFVGVADTDDPDQVLFAASIQCGDPTLHFTCAAKPAANEGVLELFARGPNQMFAFVNAQDPAALGLAAASDFLAFHRAPDGSYLLLTKDGTYGPSTLVKLDANSHQRVWSSPEIEGNPRRFAVTHDGGALAISTNQLTRVRPDGTIAWIKSLGGSAPILVFRPHIAAIGPEGAVAVASRDDGQGMVALRFAGNGDLQYAQSYADLIPVGIAALDADGDGRLDAQVLVVANDQASHSRVLTLSGSGQATSMRSLESLAIGITTNRHTIGIALADNAIWWFDRNGHSGDRWIGASGDFSLADDDSAWIGGTHYAADGAVLGAIRLDPAQFNDSFSLGNGSATHDGGIVYSGLAPGNASHCIDGGHCGDGALIKFDASGQLQWFQQYGAAGSDDLFSHALSTADNGVLVSGSSQSFDASLKATQFVVRTDADGAVSSSCLASQPTLVSAAVTTPPPSPAIAIDQPTATDLPLPAGLTLTAKSESIDVITARACLSTSESPYLSVTSTGPGTVTSSPPGIDCGDDCQQAYTTGTVVQLTASANANTRFDHWEGACTSAGGDPSVSLTLTATRACVAIFSNGPNPPPAPVAEFTFTNATHPGNAPIAGVDTVNFDGTSSNAASGIARYDWDFDNDGTSDFTTRTGDTDHGKANHVYATPGTYTVALTVMDGNGSTATVHHMVDVVQQPANNGTFNVELIVLQTGNFANRIVSAPAGLDCVPAAAEDACNADFSASVVRLQIVTVASGNRFDHWSDCDALETAANGLPICVVNNTGTNKIVSAHFANL